MAMGRWVVEATTALACPAEAATTLEGLRSCSIIHTYLACTALAVAWTPYDVSATRCFSRREIPCLSSRVDVAQGAEQGRSGVADAPIQAGRSGGPLDRRAGDARRHQ